MQTARLEVVAGCCESCYGPGYSTTCGPVRFELFIRIGTPRPESIDKVLDEVRRLFEWHRADFGGQFCNRGWRSLLPGMSRRSCCGGSLMGVVWNGGS